MTATAQRVLDAHPQPKLDPARTVLQILADGSRVAEGKDRDPALLMDVGNVLRGSLGHGADMPQNAPHGKCERGRKMRQIATGDCSRNDYGALEPVDPAEIYREYFRRAAEQASVRKLAKDLGVSRSALNAILLGQRGRDIRASHLHAWAKFRGVPSSTVLREVAAIAFEMENLPDVGVPLPGGGWGSPDLARRMGAATPSPAAAAEDAPPPKRTGSTSR